MKIIKLQVLALSMLALTACITVTDSRFSKNSDPEKAAEIYVALGVGYLDSGDTVMARKKIERALKIAPDSASAHSAMAMYWNERGEFKLAESEFERALDLNEDHSPTNYHYGRFVLQKKRTARACELLNSAAIDVDYVARVPAYEDLGICYMAFNDSSKAIDAFEKAWSLDLNSTISAMHLTELYLQRKSYRPAKRWFERFEKIVKDKKLPHSSSTLYLGYRVAKATRDRNSQASYAFKLKKRFPKSNEYKSFKRGI